MQLSSIEFIFKHTLQSLSKLSVNLLELKLSCKKLNHIFQIPKLILTHTIQHELYLLIHYYQQLNIDSLLVHSFFKSLFTLSQQ